MENALQRLEHVLVAQVPRFVGAVVHHAIIALGIGDKTCVLLRLEELVAVAGDVVETLSEEVHERAHDGKFAKRITAGERGPAIGGQVSGPWRQTGIAGPSLRRSAGVDPFEIGKNRRHRLVHAVEIEPADMHVARGVPARIVAAEEFDKGVELGVAPHPGRETGESVAIRRAPGQEAHVPVDHRRVRPVRFERDDREAVVLDQTSRDLGPRFVELRRAVGGFAEKDEPRCPASVE